MTMGVLEANLVQLAVAQRAHQLAGDRIHRVEEVGGALQCRGAAAAVVGRVVVELDPARGQPAAVVDLIVGFRDLELGGLDVRRRRRLRFDAHQRDDRRIDGDETARRQVAAGLLPAAVEEQLVLDDRAADVGGAGVGLRIGLQVGAGGNRRAVGGDRRAAAAEEERKRAERLPPEQVAALALEGIGARRGHGVVDHAHGLAEFGREAGGDDLHFLNHHLGHRQQAQPGAVLLGVRVAVDHVVDAHGGAVGRQARHAELDVLDAGDAGLNEREVVGVARDQRQVVHLELAHGVADVDAGDVERGYIAAAHRDRLADRPDRQRGIDRHRLADRQLDVSTLKLLEPLQLRDHAISADRQQRRAIETLLIGHHRAFSGGIDVGDRHGDARQHTARTVGDGALDGTVGGL